MSNGDIPSTKNIVSLASDNSYGFFLYFFDEIRGHVPLFGYPEELLTDENEKQILSIHPVWWHQEKFLDTDKFTSIDLEIGDVIYCATISFCETRRIKRRSGMESAKWQFDRFILIVKAPSSVSFIAQEILYQFKITLENYHVSLRLRFLIEDILEESKELEVIERSKHIRGLLESKYHSLIPKIPITKLKAQLKENELEQKPNSESYQFQKPSIPSVPKRPEKLRFLIPTIKQQEISDSKKEEILKPEPKRVKIIQVESPKDKKIIRITVRNISSTILENVLLKIYESHGFFGKDVLISEIRKWAPKEIISFEFEPSEGTGMIYFLKIEDENETIMLKRIQG